MGDARAALNGSGNQTMYLNVYRTGQNQGGNYSSYRAYGIYEGNNYGSYTGATQYWSNSIGQSGTFTIPYANRNGNITLFDTYWDRGHDGNGYASDFWVSFSIDTNHTSIGDGSVSAYEPTPPRIPKVPAAPTPIGVDQATADSLRYRFSGNDDGGTPIREWQIGYGTDPNNVQFTVGSSGTSTIGGLSSHTTWYFWSRGRNDVGWGPWSSRSQGNTLGHPSAPQSVSATASTSVTGRVTITWAAPSTQGAGGIKGYNVFRNGTQIATITGTTTSHTDNDRTPFTSYTYTVAARNDYSNSVSSYGPQSSGSTVVAQGPPTAPTNLQGTSHATIPGRVDLTWTAPATTGTGGITGYRIRLADGTLLGNQNGTGTTFAATNLNPGTSYTFKVSARNALSDAEGSEGAFSNQVTVTPIGEPAAPTNLTVGTSSTVANRLNLSWTAPPGSLSGYSIFQLIDGSYQLIAKIGQQHTSFAVDNLTPGTSYSFHVRARTSYTDTLANGYPGNWGGPPSSNVAATASGNNTQTVPSLSVAANSTNAVFNGTNLEITQVTANTIRYVKTSANIASAATTIGTITNTTNQVFNGTFTIATPTPTTLTYSKTNANISALATTGGLVTDNDNVNLNGTYVVTAINAGANLLSYAKTGADFASRTVPVNAAPGQFSTVTNLSNAIFNGTGKVITEITEFTISYAQTNANVAESNAAGVVTNTTNRDVFNGEWIVSAIPAYNIVQYARTAANVGLRDWELPNGLVSRTTSPSTLDVQFRSGWSG